MYVSIFSYLLVVCLLNPWPGGGNSQTCDDRWIVTFKTPTFSRKGQFSSKVCPVPRGILCVHACRDVGVIMPYLQNAYMYVPMWNSCLENVAAVARQRRVWES